MVKLKYSLSFNQKKFSVIIISNACKLLCNVNSQVTECFYKTFFASINFLLIPDTYYAILPPNLMITSQNYHLCIPVKSPFWMLFAKKMIYAIYVLTRILTSLLGNRAFVICVKEGKTKNVIYPLNHSFTLDFHSDTGKNV